MGCYLRKLGKTTIVDRHIRSFAVTKGLMISRPPFSKQHFDKGTDRCAWWCYHSASIPDTTIAPNSVSLMSSCYLVAKAYRRHHRRSLFVVLSWPVKWSIYQPDPSCCIGRKRQARDVFLMNPVGALQIRSKQGLSTRTFSGSDKASTAIVLWPAYTTSWISESGFLDP